MGVLKDMTGHRFGLWLVESRSVNHGTTATWNCVCECGVRRAVRGPDLRNGSSTNCGCVRKQVVGDRHRNMRGEAAVNWKGDAVGYVAAHSRVRAIAGPASAHECVDCGGAAYDWSYKGGCPNELVSTASGSNGQRYSPNPYMYEARCRKCHFVADGREEGRKERGRFAGRG